MIWGVGVLVVLAALAASHPATAATVIVLGVAVGLLHLLAMRLGGTRLSRWTIGALGLFFVIGALIWANPDLADTITSDALVYNASASDLVDSWHGETVEVRLPAPGKEGFVYTLAGLYWLLGVHPAAGLAFNAALMAACIPITYDTTRRLFGPRAASRVPWLMLLMPGLLVWGSQLHREQGVYLLLALATNATVRIVQRRRATVNGLLRWALPLLALLTFRRYVALVFAVASAGAIFLATRRSRVSRRVVIGTAGLAAVGVLTLGSSSLAASLSDDLARANEVLTFTSRTANTGFVSEGTVGSVSGALQHLPVGLARLLLGPLPGQVSGAGALPALADTAAWWAILFLCWRVYRRKNRPSLAVLIAPALALAAVFSLIVGNYGMVLRHRTQLLILLLPIVAAGLRPRRKIRVRRSAARRPAPGFRPRQSLPPRRAGLSPPPRRGYDRIG